MVPIRARIFDDISSLSNYLRRVFPSRQAVTLGVCSGGFSPITGAHIDYIQDAARLCQRLCVIVNGRDFLIRKKGVEFQPLEQRLKIVAAISGVSYVVPFDDGTQSVAAALELLSPDYIFQGGDRQPDTVDTAELDLCKRTKCRIIYGVGGSTKAASSSELLRNHTQYVLETFGGMIADNYMDEDA